VHKLEVGPPATAGTGGGNVVKMELLVLAFGAALTALLLLALVGS
jgi:hypothetical protein